MGVICTNLANELGHHLVGTTNSRFDLTDISFFELDCLFARSAKTLKRRQQKRRRKEKRRNDGNEESSSSETWEKTQRVSLW